jgi:hypothetical protein
VKLADATLLLAAHWYSPKTALVTVRIRIADVTPLLVLETMLMFLNESVISSFPPCKNRTVGAGRPLESQNKASSVPVASGFGCFGGPTIIGLLFTVMRIPSL